MSWEEIVLEGLRTEEELSKVLARAAAAAPEKVKAILKGFPESIVHFTGMDNHKKDKGEQALLLLKCHLLSVSGKNFREFSFEEQRNILESAAKASITASKIAFTLYERELEVKYLMRAGNAFQNLKKFSQAEEVYNKALQTCQELTSDVPLQAMVLTNVGALYHNMGESAKAEEFYKKALNTYEILEMENPEYTPYMAAILNNVGILHTDRGRFSEAEKAYKKALKKYRTLEKENPAYTADVAMVLTHLGTLYHNMGDFAKAEEVLQEALTIRKHLAREKSECAVDVTFTLNNLGNLYADMYNFSKAEEVLQEALTIRRHLAQMDPETHTPDVALILTNIGLYYSDTGRFSEGEKALKEALTYYSELVKSPVYVAHYAAVLTDLGALYWNSGNTAKAEEFYKKALNTYEILEMENPEYTPYMAAILNNMGNIYWKTKKFSKAEEIFAEALKKYEGLARKNPDVYAHYVAGVLHNLGILYTDRGKYGKAKKAFERAIKIRKQRTLWMELAETYNSFSRINNRRENAVRILELGILFSGEEKHRYAQKGKREEIYLDFLERTDNSQKVLGILEALRDPSLLSLEWNIKGMEKMRKNKDRQKVLVEELLKSEISPKIFRFHVPDKVLFLYIQKMEDNILYLAVAKEKMQLFRGSNEFLDFGRKLLINFNAQILGRVFEGNICNIAEKFDILTRKWTYTLPPEILEIVSKKDTIVLSPDAIISYFPLEGLYISGEPICLSKKVIRATSMHQLQEIALKRLIIGSSLIVGNPWPSNNENYLEYSRPSHIEMNRLKNAKKEAEILSKRLPNPKVLLNNFATASTFLKELPNHSIIHFAGHGHVGRVLFFAGPMTKSPPEFEPKEFSKLRKAWRKTNGNILYMMDEWDIVTDIDILGTLLKKGAFVFLSACETGQHTYAGGGHFQGLAHAFLKSGASNVVSSLVPLHGTLARDFTVSFYDILLSQKSVSTALQDARKEIKEKYKAPIYWLPYIHYGPWPVDP